MPTENRSAEFAEMKRIEVQTRLEIELQAAINRAHNDSLSGEDIAISLAVVLKRVTLLRGVTA